MRSEFTLGNSVTTDLTECDARKSPCSLFIVMGRRKQQCIGHLKFESVVTAPEVVRFVSRIREEQPNANSEFMYKVSVSRKEFQTTNDCPEGRIFEIDCQEQWDKEMTCCVLNLAFFFFFSG